MNKQKLFDDILQQIITHDTILIFRHANPDGDALGSQFGLKTFIEENFPNKKVYAIGNETLQDNFAQLFPSMDPSKNIVKADKMLAFVLDTPNKERINDFFYKKASTIIKIDHHPKVDTFETLAFQDETYSSTCEMLIELLHSFKIYKLSQETAFYLLIGVITDTDRFKYDLTTSKTLNNVAHIFDLVDRNQLFATLYRKDLFTYQISNKIFKKTKNLPSGLSYFIMSNHFAKKHGFRDKKVNTKLFINDLLLPYETKIAMFVSYDVSKKVWKGSLRSKTININPIAVKYNGGGHQKASGFKVNTKKELNQIIKDLEKLLKGEKIDESRK